MMNKNNTEKDKTMEINWKQQKVISNPLRSRLIAMLYEQPMTPKQTADLLGKNPGTVYYHIQQLVKHDILEVDSVQTEKGIVEKYYRAKARSFKNPEQTSPAGYVDGRTANVHLSKKLLEKLNEDIEELFYKYGHLSYKEKNREEQSAYSIEFLVKEFNEGEEK